MDWHLINSIKIWSSFDIGLPLVLQKKEAIDVSNVRKSRMTKTTYQMVGGIIKWIYEKKELYVFSSKLWSFERGPKYEFSTLIFFLIIWLLFLLPKYNTTRTTKPLSHYMGLAIWICCTIGFYPPLYYYLYLNEVYLILSLLIKKKFLPLSLLMCIC